MQSHNKRTVIPFCFFWTALLDNSSHYDPAVPTSVFSLWSDVSLQCSDQRSAGLWFLIKPPALSLSFPSTQWVSSTGPRTATAPWRIVTRVLALRHSRPKRRNRDDEKKRDWGRRQQESRFLLDGEGATMAFSRWWYYLYNCGRESGRAKGGREGKCFAERKKKYISLCTKEMRCCVEANQKRSSEWEREKKKRYTESGERGTEWRMS